MHGGHTCLIHSKQQRYESGDMAQIAFAAATYGCIEAMFLTPVNNYPQGLWSLCAMSGVFRSEKHSTVQHLRSPCDFLLEAAQPAYPLTKNSFGTGSMPPTSIG